MNALLARSRRLADWLFQVPPVPNPDEKRRRAILAQIASFMAAVCVIALLDILRQYSVYQLLSGYFLTDIWQYDDARQLFTGMAVGFVSLGFLWFLNRQNLGAFGWLPGALMLLTITLLVSNSDTPFEIANGRSLMLWVVPIALAPLVLPSWTVFLDATASTIAIAILAPRWFNIYAVLSLYVIAFISWLAARALEQALRAARNEAEKNRVILENVADGVLVVDDAGVVQIANPAARSLLGADLENAAGKAESRIEYPGRVVEFSWAQVQGVGRAAVLRDITRQVEIERAKDALLGTVSHELRTPLAAIGGFAEVIGMLSQNEKISEMAGRIVSNVGRLKGLVNSLLDQAQIQAGTLKLNTAPFSPEKIAGEVYSLMSGLAAEKHLVFNLELDAELPESVLGDAERVHQVLVNLVGNAIKFTGQGAVTMRFFGPENGRWGFSVRDTGQGIPLARQPDIFQPFRRGSDYATRTHQGAGLGLSISKQLVELMGGEISVMSEAGKGAVFTVFLPIGARP